jgi:uncharacterized protein
MANNRVVHFEIPASRPEELATFYAELFGWRFKKSLIPEIDYWLCETGPDGPGIDGAIMLRHSPQQPWLNYVDVASVDASLDTATKLGAKIALPKTCVPEVGFVAAIVDPQGNLCGLWEKEPQHEAKGIMTPELLPDSSH